MEGVLITVNESDVNRNQKNFVVEFKMADGKLKKLELELQPSALALGEGNKNALTCN